MSSCCLGAGCSRKLLEARRGNLLAEPLQHFFIAFLNSIVLSTSAVECVFAAVQQWVSKSNKPLSMATVNAKHVVHRVKRDWRSIVRPQQDSAKPAKRSLKRRPAWVQKKIRSRRCGWHMWLKKSKLSYADCIGAQQIFKTLPPETRLHWRKQAQLHNRQQRAIRRANVESLIGEFKDADTMTGLGYLGLGDATAPISVPTLIAGGYDAGGFTSRRSARWELRSGRRIGDSREATQTSVLPDHCTKNYN